MKTYLAPENYLSHRPPMLLVSRVIEVTPERVVCETDAGAGGPLEPHVDEEGVVPAEFLLEMMAQTIGVWAGVKRVEEEASGVAGEPLAEIGLLLSVRQAVFNAVAVEPRGVLEIRMDKLMQEGQVGTFEGEVLRGGEVLASGRITVYQPLEKELDTLF